MTEKVQAGVTHVVTWVDDQIVGYRCSQDHRTRLHDDSLATEQEWVTCPHCGLQLLLHCNVYIEERKENQ